MAIRMQQRQGTADQWLTADPVLGAGEIGFETDTNSFKIGDGVNSWNTLDYFTNETGLAASLSDYILSTEKAAANGVATLDANGFVPASQLDIDVTADIDAAVAALIDGAPGVLDTLNELSAALGDDANFATTIASSLLSKKTEVNEEVSSNSTLVAGTRYFVDTTTSITLDLPALPSIGDEIQMFDAKNLAATNNVLVNNNSEKINGLLDTAVIDVNEFSVVFIYTGTYYGWRMI
jgi:hypothetical protein